MLLSVECKSAWRTSDKENQMMRKYAILVSLFVLLTTTLFAKDGDGGYAGAFLRMGMSARAKALGDAYSAIAEGAVAGFYNPALLPHLKERQLALAIAFLPLDRSLDYIGYAQSLRPKFSEDDSERPLAAGFSLAWIHAGVDNIDGRDFSGNHTADYSNDEHAFYLSFALSPAPIFSVGVSGKVLYNRLPGMTQEDKALTSTGFGIDFGLYLTPVNNLSFGLVAKDKLSKYTWNTDKVYERGTTTTYKFPQVYRGAVAYRIPQKWLLLTAEIEDSKEQLRRYHVGAEFSYQDAGALRIGFDENVPTFGMGLFGDFFGVQSSINYAFLSEDSGAGSEHLFTWTFNL